MYLHHSSELCEEILSDALNAFLYLPRELINTFTASGSASDIFSISAITLFLQGIIREYWLGCYTGLRLQLISI